MARKKKNAADKAPPVADPDATILPSLDADNAASTAATAATTTPTPAADNATTTKPAPAEVDAVKPATTDPPILPPPASSDDRPIVGAKSPKSKMGLALAKASQAVASTAGNQQSTSGSEEEEESEVIFFCLPFCFLNFFVIVFKICYLMVLTTVFYFLRKRVRMVAEKMKMKVRKKGRRKMKVPLFPRSLCRKRLLLLFPINRPLLLPFPINHPLLLPLPIRNARQPVKNLSNLLLPHLWNGSGRLYLVIQRRSLWNVTQMKVQLLGRRKNVLGNQGGMTLGRNLVMEV